MLTQPLIIIALIGVLIVAIFPLPNRAYRQSIYGISITLVLIVVSFHGFIRQFGVEFGLTYGLAAVYAVALVRVLGNITSRQKKSPSKSGKNLRPAGADRQTAIGYKLLRFIMAGPVSGIAAAFVCMAFCQSLGMTQADQWVLAAFLYPLFWVLLAFISCNYRQRKVSLFILAGKR